MALVVEDGTIVSGANSYVDLAAFRAFAEQRGLTLPGDDIQEEALLILAMDYLEGQRFIGYRKDSSIQPLQWPRKEAYLPDGTLLADNVIPTAIKNAQCQLGYIVQSTPLFATISAGGKGAIMSESVYGAVSRTYAKPSTATILGPYLGPVNNFLRGYLRAIFGSTVAIRT